jgi:hypothetical protein
MNIGELSVKLKVDTSEFNTDIDKAVSKLASITVLNPETHTAFFLPKRTIVVTEAIAMFLIGMLFGIATALVL